MNKIFSFRKGDGQSLSYTKNFCLPSLQIQTLALRTEIMVDFEKVNVSGTDPFHSRRLTITWTGKELNLQIYLKFWGYLFTPHLDFMASSLFYLDASKDNQQKTSLICRVKFKQTYFLISVYFLSKMILNKSCQRKKRTKTLLKWRQSFYNILDQIHDLVSVIIAAIMFPQHFKKSRWLQETWRIIANKDMV